MYDFYIFILTLIPIKQIFLSFIPTFHFFNYLDLIMFITKKEKLCMRSG